MNIEEDLLLKAKKPGDDALKYHPFYKGKIEIVPKCKVTDFSDFAIWYTPGVAEVCKEIKGDISKVYEYTNKWNTIAIVTDGSRILGLGNIGPQAGLPVMEGKALLFKYLGGVDAFPICLGTQDTKEIIKIVQLLAPSFGGINLEDIEHPKCFKILKDLRESMNIPVWHDDQQGTAAVTLAGFINALELVSKRRENVKIAMIGAGAANICVAKLLISYGVNPGNIFMCDSKGILNRDRSDLKKGYPEKWEICKKTNTEDRKGSIAETIDGADVLIALSKPGPGVIKKEWIKTMASDSIVFVCANPIPEIWPWEAKDAGAKIVATGRSDFSNQINNSLGFPGIFRGALDVRASTITDSMCIAAAEELARCARDKGLKEDYIVPTMDEWEVFPREAVAVGMKAQEEGVANLQINRDVLYDNACRMIKRARDLTGSMVREKFIELPEDK